MFFCLMPAGFATASIAAVTIFAGASWIAAFLQADHVEF
jgi:hypothetical protein